jgi:hypothetical protein
MSTARLVARVQGVRAVGAGRLHDHRLVFDKPGRDGTAKANVRPASGAIVHGVVWEIEAAEITVLDRFEPGYERSRLEIRLDESATLSAWTYVYSRERVDSSPSRDYVDHLIEGAREHALPGDLLAYLETIHRVD